MLSVVPLSSQFISYEDSQPVYSEFNTLRCTKYDIEYAASPRAKHDTDMESLRYYEVCTATRYFSA